MIRIHDTMQRGLVDLIPRHEGKVGFYVCGPTVQSSPHIGHGRSAVVFDTIRRYLAWRGYEVTFVRNVTDIEDKIIDKAAEAGEEVPVYAARIEKEFTEGYRGLGVLDPDVEPRATDNIRGMIEIISVLIERGLAYRAGDDVYFSVRADEDYGRLSGRRIDEMLAGTRIEENEVKHDQLDFALWKGAKPGEPWWDSPWGEGRPGWHIECSAMASRYLGPDFDIHAGGTDLIFPHHENEIAQSESATGQRFARYWLHNGMVNLDGAKMAKSTGNVIDLNVAVDTYGGMPLRLLFLRAHYRAPIEFSNDLVEAAAESYRRIQRLLERVGPTEAEPDQAVLDAFRAAMDDDFSTPAALGVVFDSVRDANRALDEDGEVASLVAALQVMLEVLGLDQAHPEGEGFDLGAVKAVAAAFQVDADADVEQVVTDLLSARARARSEGDFTTADRIRDRLADIGIVVEDTPDGARWLRG
ncbi:MAG TPA: cysteine--tRNA ligase [Acidimicrobiia bacterium]|nr:cysteine--tRNA ligase [Acidimicrobiia bacterium]